MREDFDEQRIDHCENVWKTSGDVAAYMYLLCCFFTAFTYKTHLMTGLDFGQ